jgi:hypothetical protein
MNPKPFIATPMYGGMCSGFYMASIMALAERIKSRGWSWTFSFMSNESLITRARNALTFNFMKTDFTHLFFIDADIRFDPDAAMAMFEFDCDVLCGIYPKKEIDWHSVKAAMDRGVPVEELKQNTGSFVINLVDYDKTVTVPINQPVEIWNGGTGFMLIKREVFEKMRPKVPKYLNDVLDQSGNIKERDEIDEFFATSIEDSTRRLLSEDYHFCATWRKLGGKIHAAPWVSLAHIGTYVFEGQLLRTP